MNQNDIPNTQTTRQGDGAMASAGWADFDCGRFLQLYPQFADFDVQRLRHLSSLTNLLATPFPARSAQEQETLMHLLLCHICELEAKETAGAVTSATQGSVSVSFALPAETGAAWFAQTPCGYTYWQAVRQAALGGSYGGRYYARGHRHAL